MAVIPRTKSMKCTVEELKQYAYDLWKEKGFEACDAWTVEVKNVSSYIAKVRQLDRKLILSATLLYAPKKYVEQTLIHELAHVYAPWHHHDEVWKATARKLGLSNPRFDDSSLAYSRGEWVKIAD